MVGDNNITELFGRKYNELYNIPLNQVPCNAIYYDC